MFQKDCVVAPHTYEKIFTRIRREIVPGETKHLLVLLGVPAAYPRLVWLENLSCHPNTAVPSLWLTGFRLTSKIMDPIKALSRMGILGGLINNFDGKSISTGIINIAGVPF